MNEDHKELTRFIRRKLDAGDEAEQIVADVDRKRRMGRLWAIERVLEANDGRLGRRREADLRTMAETEGQQKSATGRPPTHDSVAAPLLTLIRKRLSAGQQAQHVVDDLAEEGWGRDEVTELVSAVAPKVPTLDQDARTHTRRPVMSGQSSSASKVSRTPSRPRRPSPDTDWSDRGGAIGLMVLGLIVAGVAGAISLATYTNASEEGGGYIILWGAVAFGGLMFLRGLFGFFSR